MGWRAGDAPHDQCTRSVAASAESTFPASADLSQAVQWLLENPDACELSGWLSVDPPVPATAHLPVVPAPQMQASDKRHI